MGLEEIFIRALTVEYVNVTSNGTNGTIIVQRCFAKSSLDADAVHIFDFYLHVFMMSIIIGIGTFGNSLLIWISTKKLAFTTNYFLMMIALADTIVLVTYLLYFTLPSTYEYLGFAEEYFIVFSKTQEYIWFMFTTCKAISTYGVVLMLADRYAWLNTQRRRSGSLSNITNARLAIALVLAMAILFAFPKMLLFETSLAHDPCRNVYALNIEAAKGLINNRDFMIAYEASAEFVITFGFPLLCMLPLLRGIYRWKVTWVRQLDPYARRRSSDANSSNHVVPDGHVPSPESRTPSFMESSSRAASERIDADSSSGLIANDVGRRVHQPLLDKHNIQDNQNNECHMTVDLRKRLTAIAISFILLETPNRLFQLIVIVNRIRAETHSEPQRSTVFLAELLNALAIIHYAIKFYLCLFFCSSFKEQCVQTLWCYSGGKRMGPDLTPDENHRPPLGKEFAPVRSLRAGDESPPYGQAAEDWV